MEKGAESITESIDRSEKIFNRLDIMEDLKILDNPLHTTVMNYLIENGIEIDELSESDFSRIVSNYKISFMVSEDDFLDAEDFYNKYAPEWNVYISVNIINF